MVRATRDDDTRATDTRAAEVRPEITDEFRSTFYLDPAELDSKEYHYAYVEEKVLGAETDSIEKALGKGYTPVLASELPQYSKNAQLIAEIRGGRMPKYIKNGNQILMRCPRALYEKRLRDLAVHNRKTMQEVDLSEIGKAVGTPVYIDKQNTSFSRTVGSQFADD